MCRGTPPRASKAFAVRVSLSGSGYLLALPYVCMYIYIYIYICVCVCVYLALPYLKTLPSYVDIHPLPFTLPRFRWIDACMHAHVEVVDTHARHIIAVRKRGKPRQAQ